MSIAPRTELITADRRGKVGDVTIVEFLTARIAEREAVARAAVRVYDQWSTDGAATDAGIWAHGDLHDPKRCDQHAPGELNHCDDVLIAVVDTDLAPEGAPEHIALHDPARELRRCEADRRIVKRHSPGSDYCRWSQDSNAVHEEGDAPCDDLRDLASVDSDHPDFQEEWRP